VRGAVSTAQPLRCGYGVAVACGTQINAETQRSGDRQAGPQLAAGRGSPASKFAKNTTAAR
jgi:hypothetical protein